MTSQSAKIPIHLESDRAVLDLALDSLALQDRSTARIVRIADTLSLVELEISEARVHPRLTVLDQPGEMAFDGEDNLLRIPRAARVDPLA